MIQEKIRDQIIDICEHYFMASSDCFNRYHRVKKKTPDEVKQFILNKLDPEYRKMKYLDMGCSIVAATDIDGDVIIEIS